MRYCSPFRLPLRLLLLALPVVGGQAQSVPRAEADSLLRRLQGGQPDTNRVHQLIRLGEYQVYKPGAFTADLDSARTYARQAQRLSRQLHYYPGEAQSLNLLGTISRESGQLAQSITYHQAALRHYRGHRDWKGEAGSYLLLAWSRRDKGDAGQARKDVQQAMALYKAKGYHPGVARACLELGNTYANWGEELGVKIGYYQQALGWWVRAGDRKKQADVHKDLGDLYAQQGNYARTLLELRKALVLYQSVRYPQLQGVYDLMGNMSSALGDYQEGLRYGLLAVRTAEALKDTSLSLCAIYNRLGMTYFRLKQYQKAYLYYDQAMRVARKYNDRPSVIIMAGNLATLLSVLDRPESSVRLVLSVARQYPPRSSEDSITLASRLVRGYTQLKRYRLAQRYCDQLLAFSSRLPGHVSNHWDIYSSIIPFFIASRQYAQARKYLVAFEAYCTTTKHLQGATNAQLWWFKVDSVQANHPAAIRHYQRYKQLQDSAFNETKSRQIASLDVLYETEKKEQALALQAQSIKVLSKEKQLQQQQLAQDRLLRNGLAGGTALLLLLVGVIYNRYRLKRQSSRLLEAQQKQLRAQHEALRAQQLQLQAKQAEVEHKNGLLEGLVEQREWLLREVHHRVKNNLQIIISLLQAQGRYLSDEAALHAIHQSEHRVWTMALIHQKLYRSDTLSTIDVPAYLREVVEQLGESFDATDRIGFDFQCEPLELDVVQAVPLGLIVNEAVTNALKYAFPGGRPGTVRLSLHHLDPQQCELVVEDDGVGLPPALDLERSRSMGSQIMFGLSRQLEGDLRVESRGGVKVTLSFRASGLLTGPAAGLVRRAGQAEPA